ncbi:MAG: extracellular solute-binding protein [Clostridia bacterium]|nr:extracellular solute-binding protein [Clostridia bacterium]
MKNVFRVFIFSILIAALSVGCQSNETNNLPETLLGMTSNVKQNEEVTLTFWINSTYHKIRTNAVLDEIRKRLKDKLNIRLDLHYVYSYETQGYNNDLQQKIASGTSFEAFVYTDDQYRFLMRGNDMPIRESSLYLDALVRKGLSMDLSDLFPKYAPNLLGKYPKEVLKSVTIDGKLAAIPALFPRSQRCCAIVRKDLMDKYNIPPISSIRDYESYLKIIREKEPDLIPIFMFDAFEKDLISESGGYFSLDYYSDLIYRQEDSSMKLQFYQDVPEYKEIKKLEDTWFRNGYFENSKGQKFKTRGDGATVIFDTGSAMPASILGFPIMGNLTWTSSKSSFPFRWDTDKELIAYPLFPDSKVQKVLPSNQAIVIPSTAKHPEKTLQFLEWLQSSQENYDLFMYGIQGEDYTLYDKQYVLPEKYKNTGSDYIGWPGCMNFWNPDFMRTPVNCSIKSKENYKQNLELNTAYPPHMGFYPDYNPIVKELSTKYSGKESTPEEKEKIISEMQKQLESWLKKSGS